MKMESNIYSIALMLIGTLITILGTACTCYKAIYPKITKEYVGNFEIKNGRLVCDERQHGEERHVDHYTVKCREYLATNVFGGFFNTFYVCIPWISMKIHSLPLATVHITDKKSSRRYRQIF